MLVAALLGLPRPAGVAAGAVPILILAVFAVLLVYLIVGLTAAA